MLLTPDLSTTDLSLIDTRGFLSIPGFLSAADLEGLQQDFEQAKPLSNGNYCIRRVSPQAFERVQDKLQALAQCLQSQTHTLVDVFTTSGVYFPNFKEGPTLVDADPHKQRFPWHQDHESYFTLQDHMHYLNFYVPLIKPVLEKSNLSIIPLDTLAQRAPQIGTQMVGRGATRVIQDQQGRDVILDDDQGGVIARLDFPITDIEETPYLQAGDLLLLRGDVLHRTQDADTQRVSVSFRMFNSQTTINRQTLATGGVIKTLMMLANWRAYELRFRYFDTIATETASPVAINEYLLKSTLPDHFKLHHFATRLLKEKLIAGSLLKTILDLRWFPLSRTGII